MKLNGNFQNLEQSYLFVTIAKKVAAYTQEHPENKIIKMGIGDVTMPLAPAVIQAMHDATEEQAHKETFHGYSPDSDGYPFLREAIANYYKNFGVDMDPSEVFVGDGAKSDVGNIVDLFDVDNTVLVPDPVYPVYVDTNIISGRKIQYMDANEENGFLPLPDPNVKADIIYLCSPNNPTGATYNKEQLQAWVDYALEQKAVILFDAAYEAFITEPGLPHSIFEIPGAEKCAIEFCSFSKTAGFTGMRCGYTTIRKELVRRAGLQAVAAPPGLQVQRHQLHHPAGRRRGVHRRGSEADSGDHRLLPEQRQGDDGRLYKNGRVVHRRHQLPLYLAEVPGRHGQLGVL